MLWLLCSHTVNPKTDSKTLYYSVLKLKYSHCPSILHCKARQRRKKCVLLSNSHNNCHRNYTNRILLTHMFRSINLLIFASYGTHAMNYLVSLRTTMRQGRRRQRKQNRCLSHKRPFSNQYRLVLNKVLSSQEGNNRVHIVSVVFNRAIKERFLSYAGLKL